MLATDAYMVLLRIVHIVTGVIWVGSLFVVVVFVQPSAATLGPAGAPFMSELRRRRFVDVVFIDAVFTVIAGAFLYWHDWHLFPTFGDWIGSSFGRTLTVGALLAISGLGVAASVTRPTIGRLVSLGRTGRGVRWAAVARDCRADRLAAAPARGRRACELLSGPPRRGGDGVGAVPLRWPVAFSSAPRRGPTRRW